MAQQDLDGFSTNPVVFFRFSHPYDFDVGREAGRWQRAHRRHHARARPTTTATRASSGRRRAAISATTSARTGSRCAGRSASPLRPGTTYAAIVTTGIKRLRRQGRRGRLHGRRRLRARQRLRRHARGQRAVGRRPARRLGELRAAARVDRRHRRKRGRDPERGGVHHAGAGDDRPRSCASRSTPRRRPTVSRPDRVQHRRDRVARATADGRGACQAASNDVHRVPRPHPAADLPEGHAAVPRARRRRRHRARRQRRRR